MKVLIIEDEQLAVAKLTQTLNRVMPEAEVIGVTDSIASSVAWLEQHMQKTDLVLMDIELADGQSFAIFENIKVTCPVIFTTSYDEYALKAFKVASIDYLLKPIQHDELRAAIDKIVELRSMFSANDEQTDKIASLIREIQHRAAPTTYRKRFLVKHLQKLVPIETTEIAYFYSEDRVTLFKTRDNKNLVVDYTLDEIEHLLDPEHFFRISRSVIIAITSIKQIEPYFGNRLALQLLPPRDKETIVSREKVNGLKKWIGR